MALTYARTGGLPYSDDALLPMALTYARTGGLPYSDDALHVHPALLPDRAAPYHESRLRHG